MKKSALYSHSRPALPAHRQSTPGSSSNLSDTRTDSGSDSGGGHGSPTKPGTGTGTTRWARTKGHIARHERLLWACTLGLLVIAGLTLNIYRTHATPALTFEQIDKAMRKSIDEKPLTSPSARAYQAIIPSVVRVVGLMTDGDDGKDAFDSKKILPFERGVGSGVVIIDNGTILTNLHVVNGARRVRVTFMDGTESDAIVISTQPENDLAVLRAKTVPDDLEAATMRSTADLAPGDEVLAVGFPFGIGPSASAGVVSGLKREFNSPDGRQALTNLIQFDAAANPGNSGGPLVTMDGSVVGIVTAILNPSHQGVFIGIGFAVPIENAAAAAGFSPF